MSLRRNRRKKEERQEEENRHKRQEAGQGEKAKGKGNEKKEVDSVHRMTSITRKIHWYFLRKKFFMYVTFDLLLGFGTLAASLFSYEYATLGTIDLRLRRTLSTPMFKTWKDAVYTVRGTGEEILLELKAYPLLQIILIVLIVLGSVQLLILFYSYFDEEQKMRKILAPLNELALKADQLSRMSFSEDKYQQIEDAISHIEPVDNDASLSFGDSDLVGIEAAMNNLLRRMRDVYRQQSRFVNDASHELRTPIAVIQGYANLLDRWGKTDEKILTESIEAIKNESEHMSHLVEQLLFLARGDSGRLVLSKEQVAVSQMVQEIYEEFLLIDEKHRYRLIPGEEVSVVADLGLLKQAVRILVDNASKYTAPGEQISLTYGFASEKEAFIQVQDAGRGMEEEDVQHMFERFFRSDEVRSYEGTGLGLSIAKWIVDRHKGKFEILSRPDLGTRIRIILPIQGTG